MPNDTVSLHKSSFEQHTALMMLLDVTSQRSRDELQAWYRAFPGSTVEPLMHGVHVLIIPAGGATRETV